MFKNKKCLRKMLENRKTASMTLLKSIKNTPENVKNQVRFSKNVRNRKKYNQIVKLSTPISKV